MSESRDPITAPNSVSMWFLIPAALLPSICIILGLSGLVPGAAENLEIPTE